MFHNIFQRVCRYRWTLLKYEVHQGETKQIHIKESRLTG